MLKKSCKNNYFKTLIEASVVLQRDVLVSGCSPDNILLNQCSKKKKNKTKNTPNSLWKSLSLCFSCWFKFFFFCYISEKVWFNLQSANCSHSLCTTTLPPGIPVLQSLETSFLRWACAGRFIWAWNCTHHRNIESNQARLQQRDIWTGWNWIF